MVLNERVAFVICVFVIILEVVTEFVAFEDRIVVNVDTVVLGTSELENGVVVTVGKTDVTGAAVVDVVREACDEDRADVIVISVTLFKSISFCENAKSFDEIFVNVPLTENI